MIEKITVGVIVFFVLFLIGYGIFMYNRVVKSRLKNKETTDKKEEKKEKETKYADAIALVDIEDIVGDQRGGVIIDENGTRFTAVLICTGSDFITDDATEKLAKQNAFDAFLLAQTDPFIFSQSPENVNLDSTIANIERYSEEGKEAHDRIVAQYNEKFALWDQREREGKPQSQELAREINDLVDANESIRWLNRYRDVMVERCHAYASHSTFEKRVAKYAYSFYKPGGVLSTRLTDEELLEVAETKLDEKGNAMIVQLAAAGVSARRASAKEIIELCYKQTHPITGSGFGIDNLMTQTHHNDHVIVSHELSKANEAFESSLVEEMTFGGIREEKK